MKFLYLLLLATSALASTGKIQNPVFSDSITAESPLGNCISTELERSKPFGKIIAFGSVVQKYQDPESTQPVPGVAELSFITEESVTPLKRSIHFMELITKDPSGWKYGVDGSGYYFMYSNEMESNSRIPGRNSEDVQFILDLQPCERFLAYSSSSN